VGEHNAACLSYLGFAELRLHSLQVLHLAVTALQRVSPPSCHRPQPPPLCLTAYPVFAFVQKKFDFQPGQHQTGMNYLCVAWASNKAGAGQRSALYLFKTAEW
jgi:hypothetical protein